MRTKYFNDGIVGNKKIKASFTKSGEMLRMFYGSADYKQFVDTYHTGMKINDSALIYLHNDINNTYSQEYIKDTNVLQTHIFNNYFKVRITQTDFVPISENVLINLVFISKFKLSFSMIPFTSIYTGKSTLYSFKTDFTYSTSS